MTSRRTWGFTVLQYSGTHIRTIQDLNCSAICAYYSGNIIYGCVKFGQPCTRCKLEKILGPRSYVVQISGSWSRHVVNCRTKGTQIRDFDSKRFHDLYSPERVVDRANPFCINIIQFEVMLRMYTLFKSKNKRIYWIEGQDFIQIERMLFAQLAENGDSSPEHVFLLAPNEVFQSLKGLLKGRVDYVDEMSFQVHEIVYTNPYFWYSSAISSLS